MISGPRRPEGQWIYLEEDGRIHCSKCEQIPTNKIVVRDQVLYEIPKITEIMRYCPKCGARMIK